MTKFRPNSFRKAVKGSNLNVPILGKRSVKYINFDNAASTPPLIPVLRSLEDYLDWYSGVHRGTGYKSLVSSRIYDECHHIVAGFVGADPELDTVVLVKNTTEAINKLSYRLALNSTDIVLISSMEHHSNELPWRQQAQVRHARLNNNGQLDIDHLESLFKQYRGRVKLLAICGASNVTGHVNPIYTLAKMAHLYGCPIMVDGAQLIPHQRFSMKPHSHPEHIDYLAFSGHKIYAPYGSGVLIGHSTTFERGVPEYQGGGTIKLVLPNEVYWADLPDKEEAGSPNVAGAYALAQTLQYLSKLNMDAISAYEAELTDYALKKLNRIEGVILYGTKPRVGVISFNLQDIPHALAGTILCFEAGIGLRTGCFCAQNYVRKLLDIGEDHSWQETLSRNELALAPGMVRISMAAYNTHEEIDILCKWISAILQNRADFIKRYKYSPEINAYVPDFLKANQYLDKTIAYHLACPK